MKILVLLEMPSFFVASNIHKEFTCRALFFLCNQRKRQYNCNQNVTKNTLTKAFFIDKLKVYKYMEK